MKSSVEMGYSATKPGGTVSMAFEQVFQGMSPGQYLETCDSYELVPSFLRLLPSNQPILEAGSGSGRWVAWFQRHGWNALGVDWSDILNARARRSFGGDWFLSADMASMPFPDASFGSVVALGSVEHDPAGPLSALREFARILRPGGIAIITVPNGRTMKRISGRIRETRELWRPLSRPFRESPTLRRLLGKAPIEMTGRHEARSKALSAWAPSFTRETDGVALFRVPVPASADPEHDPRGGLRHRPRVDRFSRTRCAGELRLRGRQMDGHRIASGTQRPWPSPGSCIANQPDRTDDLLRGPAA